MALSQSQQNAAYPLFHGRRGSQCMLWWCGSGRGAGPAEQGCPTGQVLGAALGCNDGQDLIWDHRKGLSQQQQFVLVLGPISCSVPYCPCSSHCCHLAFFFSQTLLYLFLFPHLGHSPACSILFCDISGSPVHPASLPSVTL